MFSEDEGTRHDRPRLPGDDRRQAEGERGAEDRGGGHGEGPGGAGGRAGRAEEGAGGAGGPAEAAQGHEEEQARRADQGPGGAARLPAPADRQLRHQDLSHFGMKHFQMLTQQKKFPARFQPKTNKQNHLPIILPRANR